MVQNLWAAALALGVGLSLVGCGSQTLEEAVEAAKKTVAETTQKTVESAQKSVDAAQQTAASAQKAVEQAVAAGGELRVEPPLKFAALTARVIPAGQGRPALLQIATSFDEQAETFPALHLEAELETSASAPTAWAGKTFSAALFAAASDAEGVWRSPAGQPVQLKIVAVQGAVLTCELAGAALTRVDQSQTATASANFSAALAQEATR